MNFLRGVNPNPYFASANLQHSHDNIVASYNSLRRLSTEDENVFLLVFGIRPVLLHVTIAGPGLHSGKLLPGHRLHIHRGFVHRQHRIKIGSALLVITLSGASHTSCSQAERRVPLSQAGRRGASSSRAEADDRRCHRQSFSKTGSRPQPILSRTAVEARGSRKITRKTLRVEPDVTVGIASPSTGGRPAWVPRSTNESQRRDRTHFSHRTWSVTRRVGVLTVHQPEGAIGVEDVLVAVLDQPLEPRPGRKPLRLPQVVGRLPVVVPLRHAEEQELLLGGRGRVQSLLTSPASLSWFADSKALPSPAPRTQGSWPKCCPFQGRPGSEPNPFA